MTVKMRNGRLQLVRDQIRAPMLVRILGRGHNTLAKRICHVQSRVHLYGHPCDMRKSFLGLRALMRHGLQADPLSGDLFVFISRRATQMKVLYLDSIV